VALTPAQIAREQIMYSSEVRHSTTGKKMCTRTCIGRTSGDDSGAFVASFHSRLQARRRNAAAYLCTPAPGTRAELWHVRPKLAVGLLIMQLCLGVAAYAARGLVGRSAAAGADDLAYSSAQNVLWISHHVTFTRARNKSAPRWFLATLAERGFQMC
jgi:hypothetical protein